MSNPDHDEKPGDAVPPDSPDSGQDLCPRCGGQGQVDGGECPECLGTGTVTEPIGGG